MFLLSSLMPAGARLIDNLQLGQYLRFLLLEFFFRQ